MDAILVILLCCSFAATTTAAIASPPHIVFILADDLGWNDVSFHGSAQIHTPNIDALAFAGVQLNKYYVNPICTPSRSTLMTGKYPIHTGMQHTVLYGSEPRGLPLTEKLLPQHLKELGYKTHIVGKWHLGHYKHVYTPEFRGFDSHIGFWTGHQDYFDHTAVERGAWGLDMRRGLEVAYDLHGQYTTDIITDASVNRIRSHNGSQPLFLYVAHAAVHSGNPYDFLPVDDAVVQSITNIQDYNRRRFAAMMVKLDQSVGAIVHALAQQSMLENTVIVFSTDNGGPAAGFNSNAASNWPLRGVKNTLWEGGVRGTGLLWSALLKAPARVANQTMHIADWLPTLYSVAGGNVADLGTDLDGIDLWEELSGDMPSKRTEVLHNIDDIWGSAALTISDWKVLKGTNYKGQWDFWYGPAGDRNPASYNFTQLHKSPAAVALTALRNMPSDQKIADLRRAGTVNCGKSPASYAADSVPCRPLEAPCLFDVANDPCEIYNLANQYPLILTELLDNLAAYNATAVPPGNKAADPKADPKFWDYTWSNFGDATGESKIVNLIE